MASQARHPVRTASIPWIVFRSVLVPRLWGPILAYLWTVVRYFFWPQWREKLFPGGVEVVSVDHPLDRGVPFRPDRGAVYLGFIPFWIHALSYMRRRLGRAATKEIARFLEGLSELYHAAYPVYMHRLSTTERPAKACDRSLAVVYGSDPHFFCLPSLHVMTVCYTWIRMSEVFHAFGVEGEERGALEALYEGALEITEAVLYVKQHSVNCIPAALYMVSHLYPSFDERRAVRFLGRLFRGAEDVAGAGRIRSYMVGLYRRFMGEGRRLRCGRDYREVLKRFLETFPVKVPARGRKPVVEEVCEGVEREGVCV